MSDKLDYAIELAQQKVARIESDLAEARHMVAYLLKMREEIPAPIVEKVARSQPAKAAKKAGGKRTPAAWKLTAKGVPRKRPFKAQIPRKKHGAKFFKATFAKMEPEEAIREYFRQVKVPVRAAQVAEELMDHGYESTAKRPSAVISLVMQRMEKQGELYQHPNKEWGLASRDRTRRNGTRTTTARAGNRKGPMRGPYQEFLSVQLGSGKTMAEAAALWRAQKGQG